jgi:hypothetical protein
MQVSNQKPEKEVMSCDEIQQSLSLYVDNGLTSGQRVACDQHLEVCPVCREHVVELRKLRSSLAMLPKPAPPADMVPMINAALAVKMSEQRARRDASAMDAVNEWALKWLQPRPARYAFSSIASIIIFTCVFAALRPHMVALREATVALNQMTSSSDEYLLLAYDINKPISPESYVALRSPFNAESPSLNPRGALATLGLAPNWNWDRPESDDDMVIVADVFMNGSASLADVMQAPRDRRVLEDFQKALRKDAAFVPAALDRRAETMRVVFSVQRVDVHAANY